MRKTNNLTKDETRECPVCGKEFIANYDNRIYCGINCSSQSRLAKIGMTQKEWNNLREYIMERDNFTCQDCGKFGMLKGMAVHHIKPLYQGGDNNPDNLITLCNRCHRLKHKYTK